ncbi:hypothetical protein NP233_g7750 [Leucocoprinus birnbaumii]|uniref:Phosphatidate phosphatase APP1 catalytic domain-containing protein n=1 Tax=Leucocoprinus birnbaumii TaxID=56174 RepID=A0AAD5VNJ4_9AGAR|nr:hypothetical protein NP233_g7750 [Leucocoprinus birnbaumii]
MSRLLFALVSFIAVLQQGSAIPLQTRTSLLNDILAFDAPAFPDPSEPGSILVQQQAFVSLRSIDLGVVTSAIEKGLNTLGIDPSDKLTTLQDRIKLLGAIGASGKEVTLNVEGCSNELNLPPTSSLPDLGMILRNVSVGQCGNGKSLNAKVDTSLFDNREIDSRVFYSPDSGFGVISDIDDTIKVSNVLDKPALLKATFLDDPVPFIYVSGSPFQLYPFLRGFVDSAYSASNGPIFLRNLTLVDIPEVVDFVSGGNVFDYKLSMIDRIKGMYPSKKFLCIGDSTEKDPETYGEAFRKYGDAISCAWIRRVDGANNTEERFSAAFAGVPQSKFRIYNDAEIPTLAQIDVAGGAC